MKEHAILFGNGLNLLNKDTLSWNDLLNKISGNNVIKEIPNTFKYEAIILSKEYVEIVKFSTMDRKSLTLNDGKTLHVTEESESRLKDKISDSLKGYKSNEIYSSLCNLPVSHYITTNYDNALFSTLEDSEDYKLTNSDNTEKIYSLRRNFVLQKENKTKTIWPIHGNTNNPKSIMLGYDHYCGTIGKIDEYLKGRYTYDKGQKAIEKIEIRLEKSKSFEISSWIDLFFTSNIHIIALNLNFEEADLWWILNKRKRYQHKYGSELINNSITFYTDTTPEEDKCKLLSAFGVKIVSYKSDDCLENNKANCEDYYLRIYRYFIEKIKEEIGS